MQPPANFLKPWIYLSKQRFQALLIVGFLLWSSLLIIETVNVQYSCTPMINWDRKLLDRCPPLSHDNGKGSHSKGGGNGVGTTSHSKGGGNGVGTTSHGKGGGNGTGTTSHSKGGGNGTGTTSQGIQKLIAQHTVEAIITVAGVGAGIAAISGAPILVIVGVGIGIFSLATKYALTLANHTLPFM